MIWWDLTSLEGGSFMLGNVPIFTGESGLGVRVKPKRHRYEVAAIQMSTIQMPCDATAVVSVKGEQTGIHSC